MYTAQEIAKRLASQVETVTRYLLPKGKRVGNEWTVGSVQGEPGESCKIHLSGEKAGVWSDFATGEAGDLLDLWAQAKQISLSEAMRQAKDFLGMRDPKWEGQRRKNFYRPEKPVCKRLNAETHVGKYLTEIRKLTLETLQAYRIGEQPGKIVFPYMRGEELIQVKYLNLDRPNGKKVMSVEKDCEPSLFGWQAIPENAREVTICEGEIDALTLFQYGFPALSVPFGGGKREKQNWIEYEFENLTRFDTIYLCFDNDREGKLAVQEIVDRLGRHRCRVVTLPHKDANECLQKGVTKLEIESCFTQSRTLDPEELKFASEFVEEVVHQFYPPEGVQSGFPLPWGKLANKIRFRPSELSIWTGINGHGKSMVLNQVMLEAIDQGEKVCIASLEIKPRILLTRMTKQSTGLHNPSIPYIRAAHAWYHGKLWIFDVTGSTKGDHILQIFQYARQRYGITQFIIDSLMKCGMGEDDYNSQKLFVEKLADFKNEHEVHVHLVAHARKSENEEFMPGKLDVNCWKPNPSRKGTS